MRGRARGNQRLSASEVSALIGAMRSEPVAEIEPPAKVEVPRARFDTSFESLPGYQAMRMQRLVGEAAGIRNPYYRMHEARSGATAIIDGKPVVNFASYDYLGLNGHPEIAAAVAEAAATWGTSVSASRITAGERPLHRELEAALAAVYQVDDAVVFVSGHATAVSALGALMGPRDLVIHDALIHNCIVVGARLSGATRRLFPHNDLDMLEEILAAERGRYERVLIATEGLFSMDGDGPDLARLIDIKEHFGCWLLVDDAHGLGVLGRTGLGIAEHAGIDPRKVDIWLGTLSKALVSCGGYVAGSHALVDFLKFAASGMVYSVGMSMPATVASLKALDLMRREPARVQRLQENSHVFHRRARERGFDVGPSWGYGILPLIIGDTLRTVLLAERLLARGINAVPVLPPGVPERSARLRFFVLASHSRDQIEQALAATRDELDALERAGVGVNSLSDLVRS